MLCLFTRRPWAQRIFFEPKIEKSMVYSTVIARICHLRYCSNGSIGWAHALLEGIFPLYLLSRRIGSRECQGILEADRLTQGCNAPNSSVEYFLLLPASPSPHSGYRRCPCAFFHLGICIDATCLTSFNLCPRERCTLCKDHCVRRFAHTYRHLYVISSDTRQGNHRKSLES